MSYMASPFLKEISRHLLKYELEGLTMIHLQDAWINTYVPNAYQPSTKETWGYITNK